MVFSLDDALLAAGSEDGSISLWDDSTGRKRITIFENGEETIRIAFSPGGGTLAAAFSDGWIRLWELPGGTLERVMDGKGADVLAFSSGENTLLFTGADAPLLRWDLDDRAIRQEYPFNTLFGVKDLGWNLDISPDGRYLAAGGMGGNLTLFELGNYYSFRKFQISTSHGTRVAFSLDGKMGVYVSGISAV